MNGVDIDYSALDNAVTGGADGAVNGGLGMGDTTSNNDGSSFMSGPPDQGLYAAEPSQQAAAQGAPGFATVPDYATLQQDGGYPQNQPTDYGSKQPNAMVDSTKDLPMGAQLLAAGPGWAVDSTGRFSSTNTPDYVRQNQGYQGGYIGPGTIVQTKDIQNAGYDPASGTFHESFNGNQDRGFMSYGGGVNGQPSGGPMGFGGQYSPLDPSRAPNFNEYGPQALQGGAFGNWSPGQDAFGRGVNMEAKGYPGQPGAQETFNAGMGAAPAGGAAGAGNPQYAAWFSDNPQAPNQALGGGTAPGPGFGRGITGVMSPDGTFAGQGGGTLPGAAVAPGGSAGGAGGGTGGAGLPDSSRLVRDNAGNVVGVRSANGSYDDRFQSVANMENNYRHGDRVPGTQDAMNILAAGNYGAPSKEASAILGGEKSSKSNVQDSQLETDWATAHDKQIQGRLGAGEFAGNNIARQNLANQTVDINKTPLSNDQSFPMAAKLSEDLGQIKGISQVNFDGVNVTFKDAANATPQNPDGTFHIPMEQWADFYPQIVDRLNKQNGQDQTTTSNRSGGGGYRGGGGNAPAAPATSIAAAEQNAPVQTQYGPGNRNSRTGVTMF